MASILQSLKSVSATKNKSLSPIQHRRNKLIVKLEEQILAAHARQSGQRYTVRQLKRIKSKETGEVKEVVTDRRVREWWWMGEGGHVFVQVRYGVKALEIVKGKNAIEVDGMNDLIPLFEKLKQASELGEFDDQLMVIGGRYDKPIAAPKKASK